MFYSWLSLDDFNAWHADACTALGIPHPNHNAATGEIDESAQWTTAYTQPTVVAEDDVRAYVEDKVAELVPDGLGQPSEPPPSPPDPYMTEEPQDG
jgi:hypothetical protein